VAGVFEIEVPWKKSLKVFPSKTGELMAKIYLHNNEVSLMKKSAKKRSRTPYPGMIRNLPEIDIQLEGIRGWLLQGKDKQVVFFEMQPDIELPPHSHCDQWGLVVEGAMRLNIAGKPKVYRKGDRYFIPEGVVHSATFLTKVNAIDIFADPERYKIKAKR
jgi:mannose-6-phosphate isomerase-like protein (cupin superfamily)